MFLRLRYFPLLEEASGDPGASGDPPSGDPASGDPPPPAITLESLMAAFNTFSTSLPAQIKETVAKEVNGLDAKIDKRLKAIEKPVAKPPVVTAPVSDNGNPFWETEKTQLTERLATLEAQSTERAKAAEAKELEADIKLALSPFPWAKDAKGEPAGQIIAYDWYRGKAIRDPDSGQLTINGVPLQGFIRDHAPIWFKNFFDMRSIGSSGATKQSGTVKGAIDLDSIRPGMSAEDDKAAQAAIIAAVAGLRR